MFDQFLFLTNKEPLEEGLLLISHSQKTLGSLQGRCGGKALLFYEVNIISCSSDDFLTEDKIFEGQQHNQDQ